MRNAIGIGGIGGWACLLAAMLAFDPARAAEPPAATFTNQPSIAIPFAVDRSPAALRQLKLVRLLHSTDGGENWTVAAEQPPTASAFHPKFDSDGVIDFAVRTVDLSGAMHPGGTVRAEHRVIVDRTAPYLSVELNRVASGCVAVIRCSDPHLDDESLIIEARTKNAEGAWTKHTKPRVAVTEDEAGFKARATWSEFPPRGLAVRVAARDRAGNRGVKEAVLPATGSVIQQTSGTGPELTSSAPARVDGDAIFQVPPAEPNVVVPPKTPAPTPRPPLTTIPRLPFPPPPSSDATQPNQEEQRDLVPADDLERWQILQRAARNAVKLGELSTATKRFAELLQLVPADHFSRFEYVGLLIQAERLTEAKVELEKLVREQSTMSRYREELADLFIKAKDYDAAREQLQSLLNQSADNTSAAVKLAKTYAWERRFEEAVAVYDAYLKNLTSLRSKDQRELATLLMTMNRTAEALDLLLALAARQSANNYEPVAEDETVAVDIILCYTRLMQRTVALNSIAEVRQRTIRNAGVWQNLAEQLYREQAFPEALQVFELVAQTWPDRVKARLGAARAHLRLYQVGPARQILDALQGTVEPYYATVEIDYFIVIGEWATAASIASQRLRQNPLDLEARMLLGNAYHASRQFIKANAVYSGAINAAGQDEEQRTELQRLLAKNYYLSRKFDQAIPILESLLTARRGDIAARLMLIQTLTEAKRYAAAEDWARPRPYDIDPRHRFALRTELGYVLLERGRTIEASREFESLLQVADGVTPDVAYGLYRAQSRLGNVHAGRGALLMGPTQTAPPALWAMVIAGRALGDCECPLAGEMLDQYLKLNPVNLVALNLRGEAAHQCDCGCCNKHDESGCDLDHCDSCGCGAAAIPFFREVLMMSPANIRARLGMARSLTKHHEFETAYCQYQALLEYDPDNINIRREVGRMIDGWQGIERAGVSYTLPTDAATELDALFAGPNGVGGGIGTGQISLLSGTTLGEQSSSVSDTLMTTEFQAKYLRGWRNRYAIPMYEGLIDSEPTNEEAYFDLGQTFLNLDRTRCAIDAYDRLLEVNPCHHQAWTAQHRLRLELRPQVRGGVGYESRDGRDGLADMNRLESSIAGHFPLGDENEYLQIGYRHIILRPSDDRRNHGDVGFVRLQEKITADWLAFGEIDVEEYDFGFSTRPAFEAGVQHGFQNDAVLRAFAFLNNVDANGESIRQDIYRTGVQIDAGWQPRRRWQLGGFYRWADYSDDNTLNEFGLNGAYQIRQGRKQLRGLLDFNFLHYSSDTRFGPSFPSSLSGTRHPYFAPSGFSFTSAGLEWKHWLSCDNFKGADQKWYQLYLGGRFDSQSEAYFLMKAQFHYDIRSWLTWTVQSSLIESEVYDEATISTHGTVRFR